MALFITVLLEHVLYLVTASCVTRYLFGCPLKKRGGLLLAAFSAVSAATVVLTWHFSSDIVVYTPLLLLLLFLQPVILRLAFRGIKLSRLFGLYLFLFLAPGVFTSAMPESLTLGLLASTFATIAGEAPVFLCLLLTLAVCFLPKWRRAAQFLLDSLSRRAVVLILIFLACLSLLLMPLSSIASKSSNAVLQVLVGLTIPLFLITSIAVFAIFLSALFRNNLLKKQNELITRQLETQAALYTELARSQEELRRFRHDFGNIAIGLRECLKKQDGERALSILDQCGETLLDTKKGLPFQTGNGIVDALLTDKQRRASESEIVVTFTGGLPADALTAVDLCVLFGNTVDNAIEACEKLGETAEKTITVSAVCRSGFLFLAITNPTAGRVKVRNNTVTSTKDDPSRHGFGLRSLQKTVEKYDGSLRLSSEDRLFRVEADLPLV